MNMLPKSANPRIWICVGFLLGLGSSAVPAEKEEPPKLEKKVADTRSLAAVLPSEKWQRVERAVDRALSWLSAQQGTTGDFPTFESGQPAVTSLGTMAFLSRGHQPGIGTYGKGINRAIDFVISCQRTNGLFSYQVPSPHHEHLRASHTAIYNHAISGLMLGEVYGQVNGVRAKKVKQAIEGALKFSRELQLRSKRSSDKGGWRYVPVYGNGIDSDLSVTGWQLMFLRSAKNAEFDVPEKSVNEALEYVRRLWDPGSGAFHYQLFKDAPVRMTRGMTGAGILCLSMAGQHETTMARSAGDWLLAHPYRFFGEVIPERDDRFFYSAYYCTQAMAQLGGRYWEKFFPTLVELLLSSQATDGSWPGEPNSGDAIFGNAYTTALAVLSLTPPYQLLPVYQR
jgi:hypothetical protein